MHLRLPPRRSLRNRLIRHQRWCHAAWSDQPRQPLASRRHDPGAASSVAATSFAAGIGGEAAARPPLFWRLPEAAVRFFGSLLSGFACSWAGE